MIKGKVKSEEFGVTIITLTPTTALSCYLLNSILETHSEYNTLYDSFFSDIGYATGGIVPDDIRMYGDYNNVVIEGETVSYILTFSSESNPFDVTNNAILALNEYAKFINKHPDYEDMPNFEIEFDEK